MWHYLVLYIKVYVPKYPKYRAEICTMSHRSTSLPPAFSRHHTFRHSECSTATIKSTIMNYCNKKLRITIKIRNEEMRHHVRKYIKISQAKRSSNAPGIQDSTSPHPGNDEIHEMNESFGIPPSPYYSPVQFSSPPRVKPRPCTGFCEPLTPNP